MSDEATVVPVVESGIQYVVYYVSDKPETVWVYHHSPIDGTAPYGEIYGYWRGTEEAPESKVFTKIETTNRKLMDFDTFMNRVPPNKTECKMFDRECEWLVDLI